MGVGWGGDLHRGQNLEGLPYHSNVLQLVKTDIENLGCKRQSSIG